MKERPIIFSAESVRSISAGQKQQTRRVAKSMPSPTAILEGCAHGRPGDRLWVREAFAWNYSGKIFEQDNVIYREGELIYRADRSEQPHQGRWTSPIFMSRRDSRITLEIVAVRLERLRAISNQDVVAEVIASGSREEFFVGWDKLNGPRGFGSSEDPFCWVIEFKRI